MHHDDVINIGRLGVGGAAVSCQVRDMRQAGRQDEWTGQDRGDSCWSDSRTRTPDTTIIINNGFFLFLPTDYGDM